MGVREENLIRIASMFFLKKPQANPNPKSEGSDRAMTSTGLNTHLMSLDHFVIGQMSKT
jgi:hypothetical protein